MYHAFKLADLILHAIHLSNVIFFPKNYFLFVKMWKPNVVRQDFPFFLTLIWCSR